MKQRVRRNHPKRCDVGNIAKYADRLRYDLRVPAFARVDADGMPPTRGAFDSPVIANLVAGWRPNARWEFSGRMRARGHGHHRHGEQ